MTSRSALSVAALGAWSSLGGIAASRSRPRRRRRRQQRRAGAAGLAAPPAASLSRPDSPSKAPDAAGFIQRWLVLEPIACRRSSPRAPSRRSSRTQRFADQLDRDARATATAGDRRRSAARRGTPSTRCGYNVNLFHFAYALGKPTSNVLFWAVTVVDAPREMPGVRLAIGSNAASVWWLNGEEVIGLYNDRQAVIDDGVSKRVTLKKGAERHSRRHRQRRRRHRLLRAVPRRRRPAGQGLHRPPHRRGRRCDERGAPPSSRCVAASLGLARRRADPPRPDRRRASIGEAPPPRIARSASGTASRRPIARRRRR